MQAPKIIPGHPYVKDLTGQKFGLLIVIDFAGTSRVGVLKKNRAYWNCLCECGNLKSIVGTSLSNGNARSCGCQILKSRSKNAKWSGYELISGSHWDRIRASAKQRNLEFSITIQDAWNQFIKQEGLCSLSGEKLKFNSKCVQYDGSASLDRINSKIGYVISNIQWTNKIINISKQDQTDKNFINMCHLVSDYQRSKQNNLRD